MRVKIIKSRDNKRNSRLKHYNLTRKSFDILIIKRAMLALTKEETEIFF